MRNLKNQQKILEQRKRCPDPPEQRDQIVDQVNSGQRDEIRKSQMEQNRDNIPEQIYVPQKLIIPKYPNQMPKPIPKLPERVIQNEKQTDLDLNLDIDKSGRNNNRNI